MPFTIADLPGATLGLARGNSITLDANAANSNSMDLLTAVMYELGHELGHNDLDPASHFDDLMSATLAPGVRRTNFARAADAVFNSYK